MITPTAASPQTPLKLIFKGRLDFGSQRTYDMVLKHWQTRIETYFKADILLKAEDVFFAEDLTLSVPQQVSMSTEKNWRSTTSLLQEVAQFAVMGNVGAWCVESGHVLHHLKIEPSSDKAAVHMYNQGCVLLQQGGMNEASEALNVAIEKYERHALAYERRGYVNYKLKNFKDALYDFNKSIDLYPNNAEPYYGRGKVKMLKNDWDAAIADMDSAVKRSLPLQHIYWLSRLRKGESLYHAKRYTEAVVELKAFLLRKFAETDPNFRYRPKAEFVLAECEKQMGK
jgi:tetratricopeptide (TPR) repeat protein